MEPRQPFSFKNRVRSFGYALSGLWKFFRTEHNLWIHWIIAVLVLIAGFLLHLSRMEWIVVVMVMGMVLSAEAFNTCIEKIMDHLAPDYHEKVKYIKDLAAGAVLITAVAAAITGIIVFLPKIIALF